MECIYIVPNGPISPNFKGGGSSVYYAQLVSLYELDCEIHLWHYAYPSQRKTFDKFVAKETDVWSRVQEMCKSVTFTTLPAEPDFRSRVINKLSNLFFGEHIHNPVLRGSAFPVLKGLIKKHNPDFIWAQHFGPAEVATLQSKIPVVYSHHDWLYRIKALRDDRLENSFMKKAEEEVAKKSTVVISGSAVECKQLKRVGVRKVAYIPVTYDPVPIDFHSKSNSTRIVHLGGMGTTANRIGLQRFSDMVWPGLAKENPELWIIGDVSYAPPKLASFLSNVRCTGYVNDLSKVLRPFDIHVIPWEENTGQRTRMVLAFNYAQVVVAVKASVEGFPEAKDGANCRIVDGLDQMGEVIKELLHDPTQRKRLGKAARKTFEDFFTRKALLPKYRKIVDSLK